MQIVLDLDPALVEAADQVARTQNIDRSTFLQHAVVEHLKTLKQREEEERHRRAYLKHPVSQEELDDIRSAAAWMD